MVIMNLDGTFIYGDHQKQIIHFCKEHKLIYGFFTSRNHSACVFPVNIFQIYTPHFIALGSGSELYLKNSTNQYLPDQFYKKILLEGWPGKERIVEKLKALKGCELEDDAGDMRLSVLIHTPGITRQIKEQLADFKVRMEINQKRRIEILPAKTEMEFCVQYLAYLYNIPLSSIFSAGNKARDYSILKKPLHGIIVANCYKNLFELAKENEDIFFAGSAGSKGVYEGLCHFFSISA